MAAADALYEIMSIMVKKGWVFSFLASQGLDSICLVVLNPYADV